MPTDDTPQIPITPEQAATLRPRDADAEPHISDVGQPNPTPRVGLVHGE